MIIDPQAPRAVTSFCDVIVWQAPSRAYGAVTGYDVRFFNLGSADEGNVISKDRDELFHVVKESDLPNQGASINIQVQWVSSVWNNQVHTRRNCITCPE